MNTEEKLGIKKSKAIFLFIQMILTLVLLGVSLYLLGFSIYNKLGGWMIASYIMILLSILGIIGYGIIGYKKKEFAYILAIIPFIGAIFVNILLPQRNTFQIAILSLLFASTIVFLVRLKDQKFSYIVLGLMLIFSLTFSIYSAITANTQFIGEISSNWLTYLAMYLSIFIPVIMSTTILVTYNVRNTKTIVNKDN